MDDAIRSLSSLTPPDEETLKAYFPEVKGPPETGTFELGLVLGGTVSAGAYTAGALDFLMEAMDKWHSQATVPHKVKLAAAAGSSGGAVCASILGVLSNRSFTHVSDLPTGPVNNLFWKVWVEDFNFEALMKDDDITDKKIDEGTGHPKDDTQTVPAVLNTNMINSAVSSVTDYAEGQSPDVTRSWIAQPLPVGITVGNLRGIPYLTASVHPPGIFSGATFTQHDDYAWFAVPTWETPPPGIVRRPFEFWIPDPSVGYKTLAQWAAASGAMPLGLEARILYRPLEHYLYRPNVRVVKESDAAPFTAIYELPIPDWDHIPEAQSGEPYEFTAVDGGTFNNDPVRLVHTELAGTVGRNPVGPHEACRAMMMIDPLVDQADTLQRVGRSLVAVLKVMVGSFVSAARYLTADLELFAKEDIFSRFQLVPNRTITIMDENGVPIPKALVGEDALAGTGLMAMAGWCAPDFRKHDFLLGRSNMLGYLTTKFILRGDNPLFDDWTDANRQLFARNADGTAYQKPFPIPRFEYYLPILPLLPGLQATEPEWPINKLDPNEVKGPLKSRLEAVLSHVREDDISGFWSWLGGFVIVPALADAIATWMVNDFTTQLQNVGLWPKN